MKNFKETLFSINEGIEEKVARKLGNAAVKVSEKAVRGCTMWGIYEPEIPMELLKENSEE